MPPYFCTQTQVAQGLFEKEKISKTIEWNEWWRRRIVVGYQ